MEELVRVEVITSPTKLNGFKKAISKIGGFRKELRNMKMRFMMR